VQNATLPPLQPAAVAVVSWLPVVHFVEGTATATHGETVMHHQHALHDDSYNISAATFTTLMLRNIPNGYSRDMLRELLDEEGFEGCFDLLYVPWDFLRLAGLGYAFVNFTCHEHAEYAKQQLQGFSDWKFASEKVCEIAWGSPLQGLNAHVEHYRNSPVMHKSVPECYKPILLKRGLRQPFPVPTKPVRAPRMKRGGAPSL